jgi:aspartyl-tRNA(Asn)/glutamyl-tRNA(Gln) amidotransferase subunit A
VIPEVAAAFEFALDRSRECGATLVPVRVPDPAEINIIGRLILLSEVSALMKPFADRRADFGPDVLALIDQGAFISATEYINAQRLRRVYQRDFAQVWRDIDVIFTPTAPIAPPLIGQQSVSIDGNDEDARLATTRFVRPINVLGLPAASVPVEKDGFLAGVQIIGKAFTERDVLRAGAALELLCAR